jgi:hypothetical protein
MKAKYDVVIFLVHLNLVLKNSQSYSKGMIHWKYVLKTWGSVILYCSRCPTFYLTILLRSVGSWTEGKIEKERTLYLLLETCYYMMSKHFVMNTIYTTLVGFYKIEFFLSHIKQVIAKKF